MRRIVIIAGLSMLLTGCQTTTPQEVVAGLAVTDPRYRTTECMRARAAAQAYNPQIGERIVIGIAFGWIGATIADHQKYLERVRLSYAAQVACMSNPPPKPDILNEQPQPGRV